MKASPDPEKLVWIRANLASFEGRLVRFAARRLPLAQAQEIVQETFIRLWKEEPPPPEDRVAAWLFTVCRNLLLDVLRKEGRMSPLDDNHAATLAADDDGPAASLDKKESGSILIKCINRLPVQQQEVVRLKFQEDMSYLEISRVMGLTVNHV